MTVLRSSRVCVVACAWWLGCSGSVRPSTGDDASLRDAASADAGADADADAGPDSGPDSGTDSGPDSGTDSGPDSGTGADAGPDADAGADAGPGYPLESVRAGYLLRTCAAPPAAPPAGGCTRTAVGTRAVLLRGTVLLPYAVIERGELLIDARGYVACADCDCSASASYASATRFDCEGAVISPGLVDSHVHLNFAHSPPVDHGSERYAHRQDWRLGLDGHAMLSFSSDSSVEALLGAELRHLMGGTTAIAGAGGVDGLVRNRDQPARRAGPPAPGPFARTDTFPFDDMNDAPMSASCSYPGTPGVAELAGPGAYLPHLVEGIGATARNELICAASAVAGMLDADTTLVHAIALGADDASYLALQDTGVSWAPRSNLSLYGTTAPVTLLDHMGVRIALGSDWTPTGSVNLLRELGCADQFNRDRLDGYFTDHALWRMATAQGARALNAEHALGSLTVGAVGDVSVFRGVGSHRAVLEADMDDVLLVLRGGRPLYGDAELLTGAWLDAAGCREWSVCGAVKRLCADDELGAAEWALVQAGGGYALEVCDAPADEPTCEPWRPEYPDGITATDADGDGVPDATDTCPQLFDPVSPIIGVQLDLDQDGRGDACDACPLDALDACEQRAVGDHDSDGVLDWDDLCPEVSDPGQLDADADGRGDACDSCALPNPGAVSCLNALGDPTHPRKLPNGTPVYFRDLYVTALRPVGSPRGAGFYAHRDGVTPFAGLLVRTEPNPANVVVGNRVSVRGIYADNHGLHELDEVEVFVEDTGTLLPFGPMPVADPARLATGGDLAQAYQAMWIVLTDVSIQNANPDAPSDFDELAVTGGLRVDDELYPALDNACPVDTAFTTLSGILGASFDASKLLPRSAADVTGTGCLP